MTSIFAPRTAFEWRHARDSVGDKMRVLLDSERARRRARQNKDGTRTRKTETWDDETNAYH
jgi:hypothetical protein